MPSIRITDAAEYLVARDRVEQTSHYTPGNVRTLTNSSATCFLSLDSKSGFYLLSDGYPRGTFGLATLPGLWLLEARELIARRAS